MGFLYICGADVSIAAVSRGGGRVPSSPSVPVFTAPVRGIVRRPVDACSQVPRQAVWDTRRARSLRLASAFHAYDRGARRWKQH